MRLTAVILAGALQLLAQRPLTTITHDYLRGAALHGGDLYVWGRKLACWNLSQGIPRIVAQARHGSFGEGGCVDPDGNVYLQDGPENGPLIWVPPQGKGMRTELDARVEMHDCIATVLLGHRGVLLTDHYGQVRFYEGPRVYQEVYSFYTPSRQAGLLMADVDGDGLADIFAGNYWIRSPREFQLPWRLFAINTRHETPDSATMTLALRGKDLIAAQGHMEEGSVFRYTAGPDPTQLWTERVLASGLRFPHALASGEAGIVVGENSGSGSRLLLFRDGKEPELLGTTDGIHSAFIVNGRILTVGSGEILWWDLPGQRRK